MATFIAYQPMPENEIRESAEENITGINQWFQDNPDKDVCNAEMWYGEPVKFERGKVEEQMKVAVEAAVEKTKSMKKWDN